VQQADPDNLAVVVGVDVDYYIEDVSDVLGHGLPVIFHTFNPVEVAGTDGESRFTIRGDVVSYEVSGGGNWTHKIWDWCAFGEFVESPVKLRTLKQLVLWLFGVKKVVYHKIHHARPWEDCPNRVLVWCIPQFTCWTIGWVKTDMNARTLRRVAYADRFRPGWNSIVSFENEELVVSFGREGADASGKLRKVDYDILMGLSSAQSVTSRMLGMGYKDPALLAITGQYFSGKDLTPASPTRIGRPVGVRVHWPAANDADAPEVSARTYASPLVSDVNMMPMIKRWEAISISLDRRVTMQANNKSPPRRIQALASEFVHLVVPVAGAGCPYSLEETTAMLDKPSQVLAIKQVWETVDMEPRKLIESFVKNEPCQKTGRIISAFADMRFLLKFSMYTLAFRDQVLHAEHNQHWFMPGGTPAEIAEKVVEYCRGVEAPLEGDFSNFDGTVSAWLHHHVMNAVYHRYFNHTCRQELKTYTDMLISCPARAKRFGFRYDAGVGVKSGSPTTCDLNTVLNAFLQYCAVRCTHPDLTPEHAFRQIGLAFGDDSLFDRQFQKQFVRAATDVGMTLKVETYAPEKGVTFLARVFVDPYTTTTTMQDPLRTWRKLHLTSRDPNIPIADAAVDRLEGYMVTDALSPVTSNYCRAVRRYYTETAPVKANAAAIREARKTCGREKPYWLTIGGSWPQAEEDAELMLQVTAARTGFDESTLRNMMQDLDNSNNPWAIDPLNRDEEPSPYVDTLDEDGQPVGGRVDDREFQNDQHLNRIRVCGTPAESMPGPVQGASGGPTPNRGPQGQAGAQGLHRLPSKGSGNGPKSDKQPAGNAKGSGRPPGRAPATIGGGPKGAPTRPAGTGDRPRASGSSRGRQTGGGDGPQVTKSKSKGGRVEGN
jgi:hypothetical protein